MCLKIREIYSLTAMFNQKTWRRYRRTAQFRISEFGKYIDQKPREHNSTHIMGQIWTEPA